MRKIPFDQPLARGRTADVYDWGDGYILKLFHNWLELENIEYEFKIARAVHAAGVKTPAVKELIQIQGRNGLVYQRVAGQNMFEVLQHNPWSIFICARQLARLHARMHNSVFQFDAPEQKTRLQRKLQHAKALPDDTQAYLLQRLEAMPGGDRICHGDFHPGNVLVNGKELFVIDWIDATRGNPLADVARTSILLIGVTENQVPNFAAKIFLKIFHALYLRHYFKLQPSDIKEYLRWLPIVAGARLSEEIPELEKWLVEQATPTRPRPNSK